jgi:hypothetical protein
MKALSGNATPEQRERLRKTLRSVKAKPPELSIAKVSSIDCVEPRPRQEWKVTLLDRIWFMAKRARRRPR